MSTKPKGTVESSTQIAEGGVSIGPRMVTLVGLVGSNTVEPLGVDILAEKALNEHGRPSGVHV